MLHSLPTTTLRRLRSGLLAGGLLFVAGQPGCAGPMAAPGEADGQGRVALTVRLGVAVSTDPDPRHRLTRAAVRVEVRNTGGVPVSFPVEATTAPLMLEVSRPGGRRLLPSFPPMPSGARVVLRPGQSEWVDMLLFEATADPLTEPPYDVTARIYVPVRRGTGGDAEFLPFRSNVVRVE
jgi:hypothetical protein